MIVYQAPLGCRTAMVENCSFLSIRSSRPALPLSHGVVQRWWSSRTAESKDPRDWRDAQNVVYISGQSHHDRRRLLARLRHMWRPEVALGSGEMPSRAQAQDIRRALEWYRSTTQEQSISETSAAGNRRLAKTFTAWARATRVWLGDL